MPHDEHFGGIIGGCSDGAGFCERESLRMLPVVLLRMYVCMYVCMYVRMYVRKYV